MTSVVDAVICICIKLSQNCDVNDDDDDDGDDGDDDDDDDDHLLPHLVVVESTRLRRSSVKHR